MVLVMWLIAAMGITVGGALALAREEVVLASSRLGQAQAFALGKGIARLAVLERAEAHTTGDQDADPDPASFARVFKTRYEVDGLVISAAVYPATGFVSVAESDPAVWRQLLSAMSGLNQGSAAALAEQIVASEIAVKHAAGSGPVGGFQYFSRNKAARAAIYVEQLLEVPGMSRAVYDRIRFNISPFNIRSGVDVTAAPPDIRAVFSNAGQPEADSSLAAHSRSNSSGYYCVEIKVYSSSSTGFVQRVWVKSHATANVPVVSLARIENPQYFKAM